MSKLNKDILFLIFGELQDDSKSLFSCLMVNRLWCETVIPILWRNPWCYDIDYSKKNYLFEIVASYLSDKMKRALVRLGCKLPSFSHQSLLFDYLSFCRSIDVHTTSIITAGFSSDFNNCYLQQEFYNFFMKKFPEVKYLNLNSISYQIFDFSEEGLRFESLCELVCYTTVESSYFYELACISQHIQKLIIYNDVNTKVNLEIVKLIEVQKNLKYFEWVDDFYSSRVDHKEILLALEKKADTINHLKLFFQGFDHTLQEVLPKLHKLKTLINNNCRYFNEEKLKKCIYHDLETFKIDHYDLKAASFIIGNSGGYLRKILIDYHYSYYNNYNYFSDHSLILIIKIHENCPLIEYLTLAFPPSENHFIELEKLLKASKNLKLLLLGVFDYDSVYKKKILKYSEKLLKILISSTLTKLKEIRFCGDFEFSLKAMEEFLRQWEGCDLSILASNLIYEKRKYAKLIKKYKKNRVIKDFICDSFSSIVDTNHILKLN
jgi:hypothetical protein